MDLKNIGSEYYPVYTWLWNTTITREKIKSQIDEMAEMGIRGFYCLGEPENFRPGRRNTHLSPEYLSDEYIDLVKFASDYAAEKGMTTWLYNEGGFPSGMVCGKIREIDPSLGRKSLCIEKVSLKKGETVSAPETVISCFINGTTRVPDNYTATEDVDVEIYFYETDQDVNSDIAEKKNGELFLSLTHDRLYEKMSDRMGKDILYMFDDEPHMGNWSKALPAFFKAEKGYEVEDYMPFIIGDYPCENEKQIQAKIDYEDVCCRMVEEHYFLPMKRWCNAHGMKSIGHLDCDQKSDLFMRLHYGNPMRLYRCYDIPGVDVIWSQISYPKDGEICSDGCQFFPRFAASSARQTGSRQCLSESFAVFGGHVNADEMRFCVNFQALCGVNMFNFMVISFDRKGPMSLQYRPNYHPGNAGMSFMKEINDYTARLSYIMQNTGHEVHVALYYPTTTICADGEYRKKATASMEALGNELTANGVSFDIIDIDFVREARLEDGKLVGEHVTYDTVIVPEADLEPTDVTEKLSRIPHVPTPTVASSAKNVWARKMTNGSDTYYFVCNMSAETVTSEITFDETKPCYMFDLFTGKTVRPNGVVADEIKTVVTREFAPGEGIMLLFTDKKIESDAETVVDEKKIVLDGFTCRMLRRYRLDGDEPRYEALKDEPKPCNLEPWGIAFSGEAKYETVLPKLEKGRYLLDCHKVNRFMRVAVDGKVIAERTVEPFRVELPELCGGETLTLTVANTIANECAHTDYFDIHDPADVGPYHSKMKIQEAKEPAGGLFGPVTLQKIL